jgi:hypothetical protein
MRFTLSRVVSIFSAFVLLGSGCDAPGRSILGGPLGPDDGVLVPGDTFAWTLPGTDANGDPIAWTFADAPDGATLDDGVVRWTPTPADIGSHFFLVQTGPLPHLYPSYAASTIVVFDGLSPRLNRPPVARAVPDQVRAVREDFSFTLFASDPDGDALTWHAILLPEGALFDARGANFSWAPTVHDAGVHYAIFQVADDATLPLTDHVVVRIEIVAPSVDHAPVFTRVNTPGLTDACAPFAVSFEAMDPDGEPVTFRAKGLPDGATITTVAGAGLLTWTPEQEQAGKYTIGIYATDEGEVSLATEMVYTLRVIGPPPLSVGPIGDAMIMGGHTAVINVPRSEHACLTTTISGAPDGATWYSDEGMLVWHTTSDDFGVYEVSYTVTDSADRPASVTAIARIGVQYLDSFTTFAGWRTSTVVNPAFPGPVWFGAMPRLASWDGWVLRSHSDVRTVAMGTAFRTLDRGDVLLAGVGWLARASEHGAEPCAVESGGTLELVNGTTGKVVAAADVPHGLAAPMTGVATFDVKTRSVLLGLVHTDASPGCKLDVYWDEVLLTPIPAE